MTFDSFIFSFSNLNKKLLFIYQLYYAAKFIEVKPYPWLEKLDKAAKKIAPKIGEGFNRDLQGENDRKRQLYLDWWILQGSNLWPYECESYALANWAKDPYY